MTANERESVLGFAALSSSAIKFLDVSLFCKDNHIKKSCKENPIPFLRAHVLYCILAMMH